jgi:hypothetical protein
MAIEAVTQLISDSGKEIVAYELRDVDFLLGLIVPADEEGIETQIRLKSVSDSVRNMAPGYEFSIYTFRKAVTSEVCRGVIHAITANERSSHMETDHQSKETFRTTMAKVEKALRICTKRTSGQALYSRLYKLGYHFGDSFHRLKDVYYNDNGEAVGYIKVFEDPVASPTVIHPATLDGILQMMLPVATSGNDKKTSTMIPTHIEHLWLAKDKASLQLQAHVSLQQTGSRTNESSVCAIEPTSARIIVDAKGVEATVVADGGPVQNAAERLRRLCFDMVWKPDISFMSSDQLYNLLVQNKSNSEAASEMWKDIHAFILVLMGAVSRDLKADNVTATSSHLAKQLAWILEHPDRCDEGNLDLLSERIRQQGRLGEIYSRFGGQIKSILMGESDALELFSQDNMLQDYYHIISESWSFTDPMKLYFELLSHKNPGMKIMEVGAGTGSTTKHVLESLTSVSSQGYSARYARYDFTDVSHSFLSKAADQFLAYPKMHFGIFDIERGLDNQGYEPGSYDVIIAANVSFTNSRP